MITGRTSLAKLKIRLKHLYTNSFKTEYYEKELKKLQFGLFKILYVKDIEEFEKNIMESQKEFEKGEYTEFTVK